MDGICVGGYHGQAKHMYENVFSVLAVPLQNICHVASMVMFVSFRNVNEHVENACHDFGNRKPYQKQSQNANATGYKWSELLRLPYWEPSHMLPVDPMHCLFLGKATMYMYGARKYSKCL